MRKILILLIFSFLILGCNKNSKNIKINQNEIIFWKYNESLTFEMLNNELEEVQKYFESYIIIPLNIFDYYLWDEQIFCMEYGIYNNEYKDKFFELFMASDKGSIFFSIIINNKIVFNGLNRIMPLTAKMQPYDGLEIPIITVKNSVDKKNVYFNLTYFYNPYHSIHDHYPDKIPNYTEDELKHPEIGKLYVNRIYGDLNLLFVQEIYEYFFHIDKIILGRYYINKLIDYNILEKIENIE
jgi:hypothetical protein